MSDQREPAVPFLDALWLAQARQRSALGEMLHGRTAAATEPPTGTVSFDGGARQSAPPPPPTHEETLVEIIRASRPGA